MPNYIDPEDDDYRRPRSGNMQTADSVMGIVQSGKGKRVSDPERQDVSDHIATCVTYGILDDDEAAARLDAAMNAKTEGDLLHLVRDLPNETKLATLRARSRVSRMAKGRKFARLIPWMQNTRLGRAMFHTTIAVSALLLAILPGAILTGPHSSTLAVAIAITCGVLGGAAFIVNLLFGGDWFIDNGS